MTWWTQPLGVLGGLLPRVTGRKRKAEAGAGAAAGAEAKAKRARGIRGFRQATPPQDPAAFRDWANGLPGPALDIIVRRLAEEAEDRYGCDSRATKALQGDFGRRKTSRAPEAGLGKIRGAPSQRGD